MAVLLLADDAVYTAQRRTSDPTRRLSDPVASPTVALLSAAAATTTRTPPHPISTTSTSRGFAGKAKADRAACFRRFRSFRRSRLACPRALGVSAVGSRQHADRELQRREPVRAAEGVSHGDWTTERPKLAAYEQVNALMRNDVYSDAGQGRDQTSADRARHLLRQRAAARCGAGTTTSPKWAWLRKNRGSFDRQPEDASKDVEIIADGRDTLDRLGRAGQGAVDETTHADDREGDRRGRRRRRDRGRRGRGPPVAAALQRWSCSTSATGT